MLYLFFLSQFLSRKKIYRKRREREWRRVCLFMCAPCTHYFLLEKQEASVNLKNILHVSLVSVFPLKRHFKTVHIKKSVPGKKNVCIKSRGGKKKSFSYVILSMRGYIFLKTNFHNDQKIAYLLQINQSLLCCIF